MKLTFHGVRGSTPCHGPGVERYGGNTSCVSLTARGEDPIVFDLGTGLRDFGADLDPAEVHRIQALVTHFHWDHIQGLPFFAPLLRSSTTMVLHGPAQDDGRDLGDLMREAIAPPLFPVTLDQLPGTIEYRAVADDDIVSGSWQIRSRVIPHVGETVGYRVTRGDLSVAYLSDHQQPEDGSHAITPGARELVDGVDVLIHDAQYTPSEFTDRSTWGHCTAEHALWVAQECSVGTLVLFHHDPSRHDDELDEQTRRLAEAGARHGVRVIAARQGLELDVVSEARCMRDGLDRNGLQRTA